MTSQASQPAPAPVNDRLVMLRVVESMVGLKRTRIYKLMARDDLTDDSEYPPGVDLLAVQIQAGGVGIDLTGSNLERPMHRLFYLSVGYSLADYLQSIKRAHRPGQRRDGDRRWA